MPGFRMSGKQLFLTYPQCGLTPEVALGQIRDVLTAEIIAYVVAAEEHADGSFYLHAYVRYDRKVFVTSPTKFDLTGEDGEVFHGNYQTCRSARAVVKYCEKGGVYISEGVEVGKTSDWSEAVELAREGKSEVGLSLLWARQPCAMLINGDRISTNLRI